MLKKHYKIRYYINVDVLAEEIVEAEDMKVTRKTIEDYEQRTDNSTKK